MNIVFEINHPGQVHLLRNLYFLLKKRGHSIGVFAKNDEIIIHLLKAYDIPFINIGKKGRGFRGKLFSQLGFDLKILKYVYKNKVTLGVGSSITNDHVSIFSKMKSIHLSDDDEKIVPLMVKYAYPYTSVILSPNCLIFPSFIEKNIRYEGTHELAYLHPNYFTPDVRVINKLGFKEEDRFFILRFVALKGHHDAGHTGISHSQKKQLITLLEPYGKIYITSEKAIEPDLEKYRLPVAPEEIHSLLFYATMFIGDSQTMTSEAGILGTPALKCNSFAGLLSVPNELEKKYGLCYSYLPNEFDAFYKHIEDLLREPDVKKEWSEKKEKFLQEKIDVTAFMAWFIENYPESLRIMKENPDYQYKFK